LVLPRLDPKHKGMSGGELDGEGNTFIEEEDREGIGAYGQETGKGNNKCYSLSCFLLPIPSHHSLCLWGCSSPNHLLPPASPPCCSLTLVHEAFTGTRASPPTDALQGPSSATYLAGDKIRSMCTLSLVVQSLGALGGLVSCYYYSFYEVANPLSYLSPFFNSSIGIPVLSSQFNGWLREYLPLYLSDSGRASQETAILGFCQHALLGIHNIDWVWWLHVGWIPMCGSHWMTFPSVSALHFISIFPPVNILFPSSKKYWSI